MTTAFQSDAFQIDTVWPLESAVQSGVTYGPNGNDYTGTYSPSGGSCPTAADIAAAVWTYVARTLTANPGPTASEVATAILSAASSTPIHSDIRKVNNTTVTGSGTSGDPWGPV